MTKRENPKGRRWNIEIWGSSRGGDCDQLAIDLIARRQPRARHQDERWGPDIKMEKLDVIRCLYESWILHSLGFGSAWSFILLVPLYGTISEKYYWRNLVAKIANIGCDADRLCVFGF